MKQLHSLAILALLVVLTACATAHVSADVAALEVGLSTAERAATAYIRLPACGGAVRICSDANVIAQIRAADQKAYSAVIAAKAAVAAGGSPSLVAAAAALAALQAVIPVQSGGTP